MALRGVHWAASPGSSRSRQTPLTVDGHELRLRQPGGGPSDDGRTDERVAALKAWRLQRSRTDGVPAFLVLNDRYLDGNAVRRPSSLHDLADCHGIGPRKLEL